MRERKCDLSGKRKNSKCMSISHSHVRTHRTQEVNLHWHKFWWQEGFKMVRLRIAARTMKTIRKFGLDQTARKYGIDLNKFAIPGAIRPTYRAKSDANSTSSTNVTTHDDIKVSPTSAVFVTSSSS